MQPAPVSLQPDPVSLPTSVLLQPAPALSGRSSPVPIPEKLRFTAPAAVFQGDCVIAEIQTGLAITRAEVSLHSADGEERVRIAAVPINDSLFVSPVPLDIRLAPGEYVLVLTVETGLARLERRQVLTVQEKIFVKEEIYLDAKNTAVRLDSSPKRIQQIQTLNKILETVDTDAIRYPGPFHSPLREEPVPRTSFFGDTRVFRYSSGRADLSFHYGIDYGIPIGTPVFAVGDGTVVMAENRISTGYTIVIEHFPGIYSLYYHLDTLHCAPGELIRTGTLIAKSGNTGLSTGPHLHLEFRVNAVPVSPDWFFTNTLWSTPTP